MCRRTSLANPNKGFSLCFRSHQMLIVLLRSRHGFRTVPGDVRELLDLGKLVSIAVRQAGGPVFGVNQLRRIGGRAVAGARPARIRRVVRRCRGSRRVGGARRCRAGCRRPLRCGGGGSSGTRTRRDSGADGRGAGHGRFRAPSASGSRTLRRRTMDPDQHEMGGRRTDDLGLVVVVGQARITAPAIGDYPRARRRGPGNAEA